MKIFQKGFNYSQDGFGNRLVYHLQGCNMKCPWCSNPEGMKAEGVLVTDKQWLLEEVCPYHAIRDGKLDRDVCRLCKGRECITKHRTKGIRLSYEEMDTDTLVKEVLSNRLMFYDGGGVTFTGGEATVQFTELLEVLKRLRAEGIHTALETNGTHPRLPECFPYISQLIMDCKSCDEEKHRQVTGVSNEWVMENIRKAAETHPCVHIRVPLIGGVNDSAGDQKEFLEFFRSINGENVTFEILQYHEFGKEKWNQCGWEYKMTEKAHVSDETVKQFREAIAEGGLKYMRT
ncbi:glycyl-radical enzyme activating protein [Faecalicatena contorta]|uniref:Pyruvate formate lyase activating enzyme n=1 Tax=Faecalicatena contorta TaxID=39482 RepID=A0A315ZZN4_9FIRM|nr:glycyl-radical enzyme activating protein [Faecalicatena contorta]PWJ50739.1 pyruvate formate lyase activating enzyme [Faecalicatena contorta]SUQ13307.1 pyruvate formate lyase activating enzyme [Faecalicatena contorta]